MAMQQLTNDVSVDFTTGEIMVDGGDLETTEIETAADAKIRIEIAFRECRFVPHSVLFVDLSEGFWFFECKWFKPNRYGRIEINPEGLKTRGEYASQNRSPSYYYQRRRAS